MSTVPSRGDDPPIDYCTDEHGEPQSFDDRFARMVDWHARRSPGTARADLERQALDYMAAMPAWRDHPRVAQRG
ncbi:MAG: hypothetical protein ACRDRJ_35015 [Streptosporangiaceae bacterium]